MKEYILWLDGLTCINIQECIVAYKQMFYEAIVMLVFDHKQFLNLSYTKRGWGQEKLVLKDFKLQIEIYGLHRTTLYKRDKRYYRYIQTHKSKINWQRHSKKRKWQQIQQNYTKYNIELNNKNPIKHWGDLRYSWPFSAKENNDTYLLFLTFIYFFRKKL